MCAQGQGGRTAIVGKCLAELTVGPCGAANVCDIVIVPALVSGARATSFIKGPVGEEVRGTRN